jgi:thioredoxin-dependent peroxiredoxin
MKTLLFGMSALMLVAGAAMYAADTMPAEGTKAPGFTLKSQEGKEVSLNDFKGKWVVLYFYPKDKKPGCTIEAHNFQRDQPEFDKKNAVI